MTAKGGDGGDGCVAFLHLFVNEFAGPSGGNGGNGGHVIFEGRYELYLYFSSNAVFIILIKWVPKFLLLASSGKRCLAHLPKLIRAENGVRGKGKSQHGKNASHTVYKVSSTESTFSNM